MTRLLNFNRLLFITILAFVSFLNIQPVFAQTKAQKDDDFALFEDELKNPPAKAKPAPTVAPKAAQAVKESAPEKISRLNAEVTKNPSNIRAVSELAEIYYQQKEYDKVTTLLWKNVDKLDRQGLLLLDRAHFQKKEAADMIRVSNILIGKDGADYEALTYLGDAYFLQKKPKDSMEAYRTAIEKNAKYEPAYLGLVKLYETRNPPNLYELRILFQDMIDNIGKRVEYLSRLCEINFKDAAYENAISMCKEAIIKNPEIAENHVYLALSSKESGDADEATKGLKKAADKFPKSELAQYSYAKALEEQKNYVDAMKYFKVGTEADPKSARSWLGLATTSFEIRKFDVALEAYKKACKFEHKNVTLFRKATTILRNARNSEWSGRFESAAEICTF